MTENKFHLRIMIKREIVNNNNNNNNNNDDNDFIPNGINRMTVMINLVGTREFKL